MVTIVFVYVSICASKFNSTVSQVKNHAIEDATDIANDLIRIKVFVSEQGYFELGCKKNNISLLRITSEVAAEDMVDHIEYWLEVYTDRLKVDAKYASEDEDFIKEVGVDQYLEELKQGISNQSVMGSNSAH